LTKSEHFTTSVADWQSDGKALQQLRREVFIYEQSVPEVLEWDGLDGSALHLIATSADGAAIGTARLLSDGHIGRVAVMKAWRQRGVGTALMEKMIHQATLLGYNELKLASQIQAIPFYEKLGFTCYGETFIDAGIPHLNMRRSLE